jgi:hypothetical protein
MKLLRSQSKHCGNPAVCSDRARRARCLKASYAMKICYKKHALLRPREGQAGRVPDVAGAQHRREIGRRNLELPYENFGYGLVWYSFEGCHCGVEPAAQPWNGKNHETGPKQMADMGLRLSGVSRWKLVFHPASAGCRIRYRRLSAWLQSSDGRLHATARSLFFGYILSVSGQRERQRQFSGRQKYGRGCEL